MGGGIWSGGARIPHIREIHRQERTGDMARQKRAVKGKAKVGDSEVIRKKLNERSSFRKGRQRAEHWGNRGDGDR